MNIWMLLAGLLVVLITFWDAFVTVFSTVGAGPLTKHWSRVVWRCFLWIHKRRPIHTFLVFAGPSLLLGAIIMWYFLLYSGWFLIFNSTRYSVLDTATQSYTNPAQTFYFIGSTLSSLGYGDFVPTYFPWTLFTSLATLTGTVVLTTSLSYVLAVLSASLDRRDVASGIFSIGNSVEEFVERAWGDDSNGPLEQHLLRLSSALDSYAHKHLAYPVLQYFHTKKPEHSPALAVLLLADAVFLARYYPAEGRRPHEGVHTVVRRSIDNFGTLAHSNIVSEDEKEGALPPHLDTSTLESVGIPPAPDVDRQAAVRDYIECRRLLVAICEENGWTSPDQYLTQNHPAKE